MLEEPAPPPRYYGRRPLQRTGSWHGTTVTRQDITDPKLRRKNRQAFVDFACQVIQSELDSIRRKFIAGNDKLIEADRKITVVTSQITKQFPGRRSNRLKKYKSISAMGSLLTSRPPSLALLPEPTLYQHKNTEASHRARDSRCKTPKKVHFQ
ncbi:hypothetical protein [Parendozoicomonas haliclonae]|uniref:Uncharacterized protein n=1 Tax=Parendozoicomonas haliclonae TaxID=1960125 RepID=A0A1X7AN50_9GAMM|nr:hypothetical protein [Parendozoicomonas haliclonae]SMA47971.1 hypothetical protein EHSB41UT_02619 [Parendozoicomonas haliclonae]